MRFHRPPVVTLQDVPAMSWDEVIEEFDPAKYPGERLMFALIERIKAAWWSAQLYAGTSHGELYIVQTDPFDMYGAQRLIVNALPATNEFLFRYDDWQTRCPAGEAFAKLEHILCNRLRWVVKTPVPWPEKERLEA